MVKRVNYDNDVLQPTAQGQIPLAKPNANNRMVYSPTSAPLPTPGAADVGKVLTVDTVTTAGLTYKYQNLTPIDPLLLTVYNQTGILFLSDNTFPITQKLHFDISGPKRITISGSGCTAVFYNPVTQLRTTLAFPSSSLVDITTDAGDATYVFFKPDGTFGQVHGNTDPADFNTVNYLCKVYHPGKGANVNVISIKPIYTILNTPQENLRDFGYGLGLQAKNFNIVIDVSNQGLYQQSLYAVVSGYNINPTDHMPSQRIFPQQRNVPGITFQYWSWDPVNREASSTSLIRTYKVDNPTAGTSVAITAGQFGSLLLFAGSDGSYILLAPQSSYATIQEAKDDALNYSAQAIVPALIIEQYDVIAVIIVLNAVAANTPANSTAVVNICSISVGGAAEDSLLPAPTTAGVVTVKAGANAYSIEPETPVPAVDLTGFVNGDILGITAGKIAPVKLDQIFPINEYKDLKIGTFRVSETGTISNISADLTALGITITSSTASGVHNLVFSGNPNFVLFSSLYEGSLGQQIPSVGMSSLTSRFDKLFYKQSGSRTFADGTKGYNFAIRYFVR